MMNDLQHRGQAGAGMSTYNAERKIIIRTHKGPGRVPEVFGANDEDLHRSIFEKLEGTRGIGHTRYGTSGSLTLRHVQPFERVHGIKRKWFTFGFNGHITNRMDLESSIKEMGFHLMLDTDTEVMMHWLSRYISESVSSDIEFICDDRIMEFGCMSKFWFGLSAESWSELITELSRSSNLA